MSYTMSSILRQVCVSSSQYSTFKLLQSQARETTTVGIASCPVVPVNFHVLLQSYIVYQLGFTTPDKREGATIRTHVAEVARPIFCALLTQPEFDADLEVLSTDNLRSAFFVDVFRLTTDQQR